MTPNNIKNIQIYQQYYGDCILQKSEKSKSKSKVKEKKNSEFIKLFKVAFKPKIK